MPSKTYSAEDCLNAVREVSNKRDSYVGADEYRELQDDHHPSVATIANRLGSWTEAKKSLDLEHRDNHNKRTPGNAKSIDTEYFDTLHPESAYWLGFIYADAHITESSPSTGRCRFHLGLAPVDEEHLRLFMETVSSDHKLGWYESENTVSMATTGRDFCESILQHNLRGDKTHNDSLPELEDDLLPHFFRGLFDGDGHARTHGGSQNITIVGSHPRMQVLEGLLPYSATVTEDKNGSGRMTFYAAEARGLTKWMYPDGRDTEPKLDRKVPTWL